MRSWSIWAFERSNCRGNAPACFWPCEANVWLSAMDTVNYCCRVPIRSDPAQWTDRRHLRGLEGEKAAIEYLEREGWTILGHRFRMGRLEIDLIARRASTVAFIEVKTR